MVLTLPSPSLLQEYTSQLPSAVSSTSATSTVQLSPSIPENQTNTEKRLVDYLMRNYDKSIRPVRDANSPVVIRLGITLTQIFDLDEKNQVLTTNVWLDQEWMDEFLAWDIEQFNLTKIRVPCEKLWLPDIVLYNSADDYTRGYMNSRAMIEPNGNVFWPPPTKFRSTCPVDVTYFPFDDQTCIMKLGSWIYDGLQVDVHNRTAEVDLSNYVANGEWDLLEARIVRNVVYYSCCIEPFPDVTITIIIRRKTLYYMYNVVLPCMMMSVLTLLVFCLPPDSGEKIALGVTVLLAFSVFMLAISEKLPETSESIPLLGIYLTAVMAITSVSVIMTVIVLNFHYRGPIRKEMPRWLKKFLLDKVVEHHQRPLCYPSSTTQYHNQTTNQASAFNWYPESNRRDSSYSGAGGGLSGQGQTLLSAHFIQKSDATAFLHQQPQTDTTSFILQPEDVVRETLIGQPKTPGPEQHISAEQLQSNTYGCVTRGGARSRPSQSREIPATSPRDGQGSTGANGGGGGGQSGAESSQPEDELLKIMRYLMWRQQLEDQHNKMVHEWRLLALAIDKVLFWVFLVITVVSSLSFLVIIPIQRRGFGFGFD